MERFYRKVIRITGHDSPNVRYARLQQQAGREPTGETIVPGVLSWAEYQKRLATWDPIRICVGIDAQFYEGAENLLFPSAWLDRAAKIAETLRGKRREATAIGVDPGEGVANTSMAAVDELGLIELVGKKTPDTSVITGDVIAFGRKHGVPPDRWIFDRGGGGKQLADRLRSQGHDVRTVAFGESLTPELRRGRARLRERTEQREERYVFKNRRAQLYGALRILLDPAEPGQGWGIPAEHVELRRQLAPMPLLYDSEGRLEMLPKSKREGVSGKTLTELLGASPDEADAVCLAIYGMQNKGRRSMAGAV